MIKWRGGPSRAHNRRKPLWLQGITTALPISTSARSENEESPPRFPSRDTILGRNPEARIAERSGLLRKHPLVVLAAAALLLLAVLVWAGLAIARAFPPRTVRMATGPAGSADAELGARYRAYLSSRGVDLVLVPTAGKLENLELLRNRRSGISVGFSSGGLTTSAQSPGVVSLGTTAYDPIWIFCHGVSDPPQFSELKGKRMAIGTEGSATRALALRLLHLNRLDEIVQPVSLSPIAGGEALLRGEVDCACMLTYAEAPVVRKLLADPRADLIGFPRADAYVALFPYFRKLTLPMGIGDLATNRPPHDVTLIAAAETLLVREDLHPAVQYLLLEAAAEIHSTPGIFQKPGEYPAPEPVDVPLSDEARQFYKSGGTFLQRHLPFWLWVFASRLLIILVPLVGVIYPLVQIVPKAISFEYDRRLNRLYTELQSIEARLGTPGSSPQNLRGEFDRLVEKARKTRVPASYASALYTLKNHAKMVRERLDELSETRPA
jgi:TRAP-type uncharacterized transport system substrate-binding protein